MDALLSRDRGAAVIKPEFLQSGHSPDRQNPNAKEFMDENAIHCYI